MNSLFAKGSLERIFVACAALIVASSLLIFYGIYVVKMPQVIHETMMVEQPAEFVAMFDWQEWQAPDTTLRVDHQAQFAGDFEVRPGVLRMLFFNVQVIQARGPGVTKFLDGQRDEARIIPNTRNIAGMAGVFVLLWAAMVMWVVSAVQTRRRMLKDGTMLPV